MGSVYKNNEVALGVLKHRGTHLLSVPVRKDKIYCCLQNYRQAVGVPYLAPSMAPCAYVKSQFKLAGGDNAIPPRAKGLGSVIALLAAVEISWTPSKRPRAEWPDDFKTETDGSGVPPHSEPASYLSHSFRSC